MLLRAFKLRPSNKGTIDDHVPDQTIKSHTPEWKADGMPLFLKEKYPNIPSNSERFRVIVLDYLRRMINNTIKGDHALADKVYSLSQRIFYYMVFDLCNGNVNRDYIQLMGEVAVVCAANAYHALQNNDLMRGFRLFVNPTYEYNDFHIMMKAVQGSPGFRELVETDDQKEASRIYSNARPNSKVLAHGAYGAICYPPLCNIDPVTKQPVFHTNKKQVSKIYFDPNSANKAISNIEKLQGLMAGINSKGFEGKRHTRRRGKNLGATLLASIEQKAQKRIQSSNEIHAILLPHLGKSIEAVLEDKEEIKAFRSCEFHKIMEQLMTCQSVLDRLASKNYVHGDLCSPNMMWSKETGDLTIIDWDWLRSYRSFVFEYDGNFGHPRNPPESLLVIPQETNDEKQDFEYRKNAWIYQNAYLFDFEFKGRYFDPSQPSKTFTVEELEEKLKKEIDEALKENKTLFDETMKTDQINEMKALVKLSFPSFDSFAYAHVMLNLFALAYPTSVYPDQTESTLYQVLKTRLTSNGKPYSEKYLRLIVSTLLRVIGLYRKMGDFRVAHRVNAEKGLEEMKIIHADFERQHVALTGAVEDVGDVKEAVADAVKVVDKVVEAEKKNNAKPSGISLADLEFLKLEMSKLQNKKGGGRKRTKKRQRFSK